MLLKAPAAKAPPPHSLETRQARPRGFVGGCCNKHPEQEYQEKVKILRINGRRSQKLIPNRSFSESEGGLCSILEGSWGDPGAVFGDPGGSWGVLGLLGGVLARLWRVLGRLGGVLEVSWDGLGSSWVILGRPGTSLERLGASWGGLEVS